ncbi:MAG: hypothetical protein ISS72_11140 [Candidatus Brocadiae bacterium]|nr:hypothetical protein [Candidatus Brocadiia bacterium]
MAKHCADTQSRRGWTRRWGKLAAGLLLIWAVVFWLAPWLQRFGPVKRVHESVRERGIDATALVYTEVEEFADADCHVRDALRY